MEQQEEISSTATEKGDELNNVADTSVPKLGRGMRGNIPKVRYTPSAYDIIKSKNGERPMEVDETTEQFDVARNELTETPINSQGNLDNLRCGKKVLVPSKRMVDAESQEETTAAKLFVKKVKQGKLQVTKMNDIACYEAAFGDNAYKTVTVRDRILTKVPVVTRGTQTDERSEDSELKAERNKNTELMSVLVKCREQIKILTDENRALKTSSVATGFTGPSLDEIRQAVAEEMEQKIASVKRDLSIIRNNFENPTDAAVAAFGVANSRVTFAGVNISNEMLLKAKDAGKLSTRITWLIRGYWSPEELALAGCRRPKNATNENYVEVKDADVENIKKMVDKLQEDEVTKINVPEEDLTLKKVKHRVLQSLKATRRCNVSASAEKDDDTVSTAD